MSRICTKSERSEVVRAWALGLVALILMTTIAGGHGARALVPTASSSLQRTADARDSDGTTVQTAISGSPSASPVSAGPIATPGAVTLAIDQLLTGEQGVFGVVLMRPNGDILYSRNGNTPFVSASLFKLVLMADIGRALDEGVLLSDMPLYVAEEYYSEIDGTDSYFDPTYAGYETTVEEAMFATGAYSSNVAARALLTLTSPEELNSTAAELGLTGTFLFTDPVTTPDWPPLARNDSSPEDAATAEAFVLSYATDGQVNITTPLDMARFFRLLLRGKVVNKRVSTMILDILKQQVVDNRFPVLLPKDTELAHKTGNLDLVVHDCGIIYSPNGTMILAAMVQAPASDERATEIVQRLALIAYGTLDVPPMPPIPSGDGTGVDEVNQSGTPTPGDSPGDTGAQGDGA